MDMSCELFFFSIIALKRNQEECILLGNPLLGKPLANLVQMMSDRRNW